MIAGESSDVSMLPQLVDDDLDIDPYHYTITLYNTGLVSTRYNMMQKTMRILLSQQSAKKVCACVIHLTVERGASTAGLYSAFLLFSVSRGTWRTTCVTGQIRCWRSSVRFRRCSTLRFRTT